MYSLSVYVPSLSLSLSLSLLSLSIYLSLSLSLSLSLCVCVCPLILFLLLLSKMRRRREEERIEKNRRERGKIVVVPFSKKKSVTAVLLDICGTGQFRIVFNAKYFNPSLQATHNRIGAHCLVIGS